MFRNPINNLQKLQRAIEAATANVGPGIPTIVLSNLHTVWKLLME
jgi:hypothetical protein